MKQVLKTIVATLCLLTSVTAFGMIATNGEAPAYNVKHNGALTLMLKYMKYDVTKGIKVQSSDLEDGNSLYVVSLDDPEQFRDTHYEDEAPVEVETGVILNVKSGDSIVINGFGLKHEVTQNTSRLAETTAILAPFSQKLIVGLEHEVMNDCNNRRITYTEKSFDAENVEATQVTVLGALVMTTAMYCFEEGETETVTVEKTIDMKKGDIIIGDDGIDLKVKGVLFNE